MLSLGVMRIRALVLSIIALPLAAFAQDPGPLSAAEVPALSLPDLQGRVHRLSDYRGKVVMVNFWASWCGPCREETPSIERLRRELRGEPFVVLAVNVGEGPRAASRFAQQAGIGSTVLVDRAGEAARAWGARALPTTFLVGPDGRVRYSHIGAADWASDSVRMTIESLMFKAPSLQVMAAALDADQGAP